MHIFFVTREIISETISSWLLPLYHFALDILKLYIISNANASINYQLSGDGNR